jgi:hypothetical protein
MHYRRRVDRSADAGRGQPGFGLIVAGLLATGLLATGLLATGLLAKGPGARHHGMSTILPRVWRLSSSSKAARTSRSG